MLLRIGVIAMSFSAFVTLVLVVILAIRDSPEEVVATEAVAASPEPTTEQAYQGPRDKMLDLPSPEPVQPSEPQQEPESVSESVSEPETAAASGPEPEPVSETQPGSGQEQDSLPLAGSDWPVPSAAEIK